MGEIQERLLGVQSSIGRKGVIKDNLPVAIKYPGQRMDELYGGKPGGEVVFHVAMRDQLFARTSPVQHVVLGYFSP